MSSSEKPKSARRRSRELAMQGLYQWLLSAEDSGAIQAHLMDSPGFDKADRHHFDGLLQGSIRSAAQLREEITPYLDRPVAQLSPVEHATLLVACYELQHHVEIPYRVVINEAVEIAKSFGGTDSYKYINGVLDKIAAKVRPHEGRTQAAR
jgi:transcription antitermination protein NusB